MWNQTSVSRLLNIPYPVLQGPFGGGLSSPQLVATVSNAGGLGGYGAYQLEPEQIAQVVSEIRLLTNKPFNLNLWVNDADPESSRYSNLEYDLVVEVFKPFFDELGIPVPPKPADVGSRFERQVETVLRLRPAVFSFVFGIPDAAVLAECRRQGILTAGAATTLDEALALEAVGVDLIVASGFEAGGHRPSFLRSAEDSLTGTFVLVQQIARAVKTPLVAAGGIADARGIRAAFALGAAGVQIGTAFLACEESNATAGHRKAIFSEQARYSTLTKAFTGRLGRGMANKISATVGNTAAPFPLQTTFMAPLRQAALEQGRNDLLTFWAGQGANLVTHHHAGELMKTLVDDMNSSG